MQKLKLGSTDLAELAAEVFGRGGHFSFIARGSSMLPTLKDGDLLTAAYEDPFSIKKDDLLMYRTGDRRAAVHRVSDVSRASSHGEIFLSSDSSPQDRYGISTEQVMGRIVSATRNGKPVRIDTVTSGSPQTISAQLMTGFKSSLRSTVKRVFSFASGFRLYRKLLVTLLRPFVKYQILPSGQPSGRPGTSSTTELLQAKLFRRIIGSAQLIRFDPGTPFGENPWLFSMRVRSVFRGGGVGRGLTSLAICSTELSEDRTIGLIVEKTNNRAVNLYRSMGFEFVPFTDLGSGLRDKLGSGKAIMLRKQP